MSDRVARRLQPGADLLIPARLRNPLLGHCAVRRRVRAPHGGRRSIDARGGARPAMGDLWRRTRPPVTSGGRTADRRPANRPELRATLVELMEPWAALAEQSRACRLTPSVWDIAFGTVLWYLGVNLVTHLDPAGSRIDSLSSAAASGRRSWRDCSRTSADVAPLPQVAVERRNVLRARGPDVALPPEPVPVKRRLKLRP
jgi:hypothetical protein